MACASSCATKSHSSMGECLRNQGIRVAYANSANGMDYTAQKRWDKNLESYRDARAQGIQPAGTGNGQIRAALDASDAIGTAYRAG